MGDVYVEADDDVDRFTLAWTHLVDPSPGPDRIRRHERTLAKEQR